VTIGWCSTPAAATPFEAGEAVGDDDAVGVDEFVRPGHQFALAEARDDAQAQGQRTAIEALGQRGHERGLVGRAASGSLAMNFAAPVDVVDLDDAAQSAIVVALEHALQELVFDAPGGVVGDAELALELERRAGVFLLCE
jgi:hypothetical protein